MPTGRTIPRRHQKEHHTDSPSGRDVGGTLLDQRITPLLLEVEARTSHPRAKTTHKHPKKGVETDAAVQVQREQNEVRQGAARGKDGDTNVHSRVAAIRYHVGSQSETSRPLESCNGNCYTTKLDK